MTISDLSRLCSLIRASFPGIDSGKDLSLLLEIGRRQEAREELTLKQLCLCGIASSATVRRRLRKLIDKKIVQRRNNRRDGRSVDYSLSDSAARKLKQISRTARHMAW